MTVIVWLKHKWNVYLASDWRTSEYDTIADDNSVKQFQYNWTWIGISWNVSSEQMLRYVLATQITDKSFKIETTTDIYAIYSLILKHAKEIWYYENWWDIILSCIFTTQSGKLFKLRPDGSVMEFKTYTTTGCWWDAAEILLDQIKITNPENDLKFVLKQVFKKNIMCWGKITINCIPSKKIKSKIKKLLNAKKKK